MEPELGRSRLVAGLQPVREAIRVHGERLSRVLIDDRALPRLDALARFAVDRGVGRVERVSRRELDRQSEGAQHQGVLAFAPPLGLVSAEALWADPALLGVALDGIQDPQNFGAVIRSAVGIAGAAVIWGEHSSAPLSTATFRASAGAIEHARLCRVKSLVGALTAARDAGIQVVGLEARADRQLGALDLTGPTVLVIGSEGEGMARAVRRACSALAQLLPMTHLDSLNASVASGIALYEAIRQRSR
ncbi:MAG: RNA methyltransferase [Myxococcales bacterium]|nr:RNA methyltransferase [Myxococcales bacterium]